MNRRNLSQILIMVVMISFIFGMLSLSFASEPESVFDFKQYDNTEQRNGNADLIAQKTMGTAITVIRIIATGVAVVMLSYMGIKYMMAAPSEKAEFKKSAFIYILGAILIFAAGNILGIIVNMTTSNITTSVTTTTQP